MTSDHPTDAAWEQLATGELAGDAKAEVMKHVIACAECARKWRAIRHVAREARAFDPSVPTAAPDEASGRHVTPFRRTRRALIAGGLTALAVAAALLIWIRLGSKEPDHDGLRGGSDHPRIELIAPAENAARLEWRPVAGAERYVVEVFSLDGRPIWKSAASGADVEVRPALPSGDYRWQVEALAGGRRIAVSGPARFTVSQ